MAGILEFMPPGHEYNRWTLPLDQGPYMFSKFRHRGKPLDWDPTSRRHGLYISAREDVDTYFWMTQNKEVEIRAHDIEDLELREMFCRSMGGHWSKQRNKFFRFPEKEVRIDPNSGKFVEVEPDVEFHEAYGAYDHTLIGRALLLSKLEEAALHRNEAPSEGDSEAGHLNMDVIRAFDRRVAEIIDHWRLCLIGLENWLPADHGKIERSKPDAMVDSFIMRVEAADRALQEGEVDVSPKRRQKRKRESDDEHSPETRRAMECVDMELRSGARLARGSPLVRTRRALTRSLDLVESVDLSGQGSGTGNAE
jgi:hypothetical protein